MNKLRDLLATPITIIVILILFVSLPFALLAVLIGGKKTARLIIHLYLNSNVKKSEVQIDSEGIKCGFCDKEAHYFSEIGNICIEHKKELIDVPLDRIAAERLKYATETNYTDKD